VAEGLWRPRLVDHRRFIFEQETTRAGTLRRWRSA